MLARHHAQTSVNERSPQKVFERELSASQMSPNLFVSQDVLENKGRYSIFEMICHKTISLKQKELAWVKRQKKGTPKKMMV